MTLWLPFVALFTALGSPGLAVSVTGDDALADEVQAVQRRVQQTFGDDVRLVVDEGDAALGVHLRRVDDAHLQLTIRDGGDVVVDQLVDGPADTRSATTWVIVRATVDRALIDGSHDGPADAAAGLEVDGVISGPAVPEARADRSADRTADVASPWSADVCAGSAVSIAPDATVGIGADVGVGAAWQKDTWIRVGVDAGYRAYLATAIVHTAPVGVRAAFGAPLDAATAIAPYGEAWLAARPPLLPDDAGSSSLHAAVGVGVGVRMRGPAGTTLAARAGVELRALREDYVAASGSRVVDSVIALPVAAWVGVPLAW